MLTIDAVILIYHAARKTLGPVRCPGLSDVVTPSAIRHQVREGDIGMIPATLGDLLNWAVADPQSAANLARSLGGVSFEPVEGTSKKILILRNGSALLWESVRGVDLFIGVIGAITATVLVSTSTGREYLVPGMSLDDATTYRDELIAQWTKVLT